MCDDMIFDYLHLANMAGMADITYGDLNLDVSENVVLGLMIYCVMI